MEGGNFFEVRKPGESVISSEESGDKEGEWEEEREGEGEREKSRHLAGLIQRGRGVGKGELFFWGGEIFGDFGIGRGAEVEGFLVVASGEFGGWGGALEVEDGEIEVGFGGEGIEFNGLAEFIFGGGEPAFFADGHAEILVGERIFGIEESGLGEGGEGGIELGLVVFDHAEGEPREGGIGVKADGFFEEVAGEGILFEAIGDEADGAEDFFGEGGIVGGGGGAEGVSGGALVDEGGGIGHDADDAVEGTGGGLEGWEGEARDDGDEEFLGGESGEIAEGGEGVWGFDAEDEGIALGGEVGGGGGGEDARGSGEAIGGGGVEIGDEEIGGGEGAGLGDAEEESGRHFAGTDKAEFHRGRIENGKGRGGKRKVWVGGWRVEIFGLKGEG